MTTPAGATATAAAPASAPVVPHPGAVGDDAVRTHGLTKRFRTGQVAVDRVDLLVPRGAVYGFLGPNGSGKTTTIRMLLGLVAPTAGEVHLLGSPMPRDAGRVLPRVGALVEGPAFQPYLSGRANLARLDAVDASADPRTARARSDAALDRVGLGAAADKRYRQYSLGMKQRLGLAAALLRPRDLLVLDEPTNGLDPQGTREVRHLVRELADAGTTVLVSSHLLAEIEQVCTHVGIMGGGRLLLQGPRADLTARRAAHVMVRTAPADVDAAVVELRRLGLVDVTVEQGVVDGGVTVVASDAADDGRERPAPQDVAAALVRAGVGLLAFDVRRPSLEQVFVELTGEGFDVAR
ncbi:ATP-binding cassette domain-containing protein [Cellulomonas sp. zg-ZUI199]|uniref:ATP-binding cassette domain-containing protein n=1 Tax=Cellulomonas wangleii TaxID=2816956 RepID=A0ABX8D7W1_9CELL|nr:ATP-binding cassette domain-containing protein [Cellulomonas sp. zg-ZUI22]MBO0925069.1 ATP-binding cassette domain-containing protein [Cellulomonas wangleii]QVI63517.1 ATP-binding cassette domain-containing protein [Cellulomonas wangleii]